MSKETTDKGSHNRRRSNKISYLKKKNYKLQEEIADYMKSCQYTEKMPDGTHVQKSTLSDIQIEHLKKLSKAAGQCANYSLYSKNLATNEITYIASGTCNHKCCNVCNFNKKKATRRKFVIFFNENPTLKMIVTAQGKTKVVTNTQFIEKWEKKKARFLCDVPYDLMHLTLTVPHYADTGFRGVIYFYSQIIELFNWMRKDDIYLDMVYGGEFGVETERKDNGMHIHIHALLLVRRFTQNRNDLHAFIFKKWNRLTVNPYCTRDKFTIEEIESIKKGNKAFINDEYIAELNCKGATIINLETIYSVDENGRKHRGNEWGSEAMINAVLETISYHFEPHAFDKSDGKINIELLADLLPHVYKKILYKKFGCLHGEKSLNIASETDPDDMLQNLREAAAIEVDEETGEITNERQFFIINPSLVLHDSTHDNKIIFSKRAKTLAKPLDVSGSGEAIKQMAEMIAGQYATKRKPVEIPEWIERMETEFLINPINNQKTKMQ